MIYRLRKKFVLICTVSVLAVIILVFALITAFNVSSMNRNLDILADSVSEGGGRFPDRFNTVPPIDGSDPKEGQGFDFITPETPFSTRYFTVWFDSQGNVTKINTEAVHSVSEEDAVLLARETVDGSSHRGWRGSYRYKIFSVDDGKAIVFIDGSMNRASLVQTVTITALVLLGCAALVILLVFLLSTRAVKPIADSYERQKQFVTDANHELKTPLTLILANLDIAEAELGKNEWLDDIRAEGYRMTELVNQLIALSRMDEDRGDLCLSEVDLSELVSDATSDFEVLCEDRGKTLVCDLEAGILCLGDETLLRRLLSILLDNAVKYCDDGGEITVRLERRRSICLTVENTYANVGELELERLFDRFYRTDKARSFTGGYGIGLSIAKGVADKHKAELSAYKKDDGHIGFRLVMKPYKRR